MYLYKEIKEFNILNLDKLYMYMLNYINFKDSIYLIINYF